MYGVYYFKNTYCFNNKIEKKYQILYLFKMSSFLPLFDNLNKNIPKKDLTKKQKEEFIKNISKIDDNALELIYVLINFHYKNTEGNFTELPYNMSKNQNDNKLHTITINLDDLPISLRHILYKFILLNLKKNDEDISS